MRKLGQMLLEDGVITKEQLATALRHQEQQNGLLGIILLNFGYITEKVLLEYLDMQKSEATTRSR